MLEEKQRAVAEIATAIDEKQRTVDEIAATVEEKQQSVTTLTQKAEKKQKQLDSLEKKTTIAKEEAATFAEIDSIGTKRTILGVIAVSPADWQTVSALAKEGVKSRSEITGLKAKISDLLRKVSSLETRLKTYEGVGITDKMRYYEAKQRAPQRMLEAIADIMRKPPEKAEQEHPTQNAKERLDWRYRCYGY